MTKNFKHADRLVKKQIVSLNQHIPHVKKTLSELLNEERPHVQGEDGARHRFHKAELNKLAKIIPRSEHNLLKLPIYIEFDATSSGALITGKQDCAVIEEILSVECENNEIFIYRPYIRILRKELPTATQYIFLNR
jgi:uncharacterized protein (UPF0216 family)